MPCKVAAGAAFRAVNALALAIEVSVRSTVTVFGVLALVEDDQQALACGLAGEDVVVIGHDNVLLVAQAQRGMVAAQLQQALHVGVDILLFGSAAGRGEGVVLIAGEASGKVVTVVGIFAAGHGDFVTGINLRDAAQRGQQRETQASAWRSSLSRR